MHGFSLCCALSRCLLKDDRQEKTATHFTFPDFFLLGLCQLFLDALPESSHVGHFPTRSVFTVGHRQETHWHACPHPSVGVACVHLETLADSWRLLHTYCSHWRYLQGEHSCAQKDSQPGSSFLHLDSLHYLHRAGLPKDCIWGLSPWWTNLQFSPQTDQ
jgi:hypothetical protein